MLSKLFRNDPNFWKWLVFDRLTTEIKRTVMNQKDQNLCELNYI